MNAGQLLHLSLVLHMIGLATVGGSNLVAFVMQGQFWKQYALDKDKGVAIMSATSRIPVITMIGVLLLILSGVSMMAITHGVFGEQFWFRVKIIVLLIIIVNGFTFGRRSNATLKKLITEDTNGNDMTSKLQSTRRQIRIFYFIQLALLVTIFVLSIFKFN
jgi:uncharacterized membrane protein SirB2